MARTIRNSQARDQIGFGDGGGAPGIAAPGGGLGALLGNEAMKGMLPAAEDAPGPFAGGMNALLSAAFGRSLSGLSCEQDAGSNRGIGALASTEGRSITTRDDLGGRALDDPEAAEILAHEAAHALAGGGRGETELDQPGDRGELAADRAGASFRRFMEGGMRGPLPRLEPARGGKARRHRLATGEHAKAVEHSVSTVTEHQGATQEQIANAQASQEQIDTPIVLNSGVPINSEDMAALMGDFYGVYDECGEFDHEESFKMLMNADKEEVEKLVELVHKEKNGETVNMWEYEEALKNRPEGQLGYLDLASLNSAHFSADTMEGGNNNMATYSYYHQQALAFAQSDPNKARAYEAAAMHFLTDRQASGHQFDKEQVMQAAGSTDLVNNLVMLGIHDMYNHEGVEVTNGSGDTWTAYGDGDWDDKDEDSEQVKQQKDQNRFQTSVSITTSYAELQAVINGEKTAEEVQQEGYGAYDTVPQWNQDLEDEAEKFAEDATRGGFSPDALKARFKVLYQLVQRPEIWDTVDYVGGLVTDWAGNSIDGAIDWGKDSLGKAWDWTKDTAGGAWDWTKDTAGGAWDWTKDTAGGVWDWTKDTAGGVWDWGSNTVGGVVDWGKDSVGGLVDWGTQGASSLWDWATETPGKIMEDPLGWGWDTIKGATGFVGDSINKVGAWGADTVGGALGWGWDTVKGAAGWGWDTVKDVGGWGWDTVKDVGGWGWDTVKDVGSWGWDTAKGVADWGMESGGKLWGWGADTAKGAFDWGVGTAESLVGWAGDTGKDVLDWGKQSVDGAVDKATWMWDAVTGGPEVAPADQCIVPGAASDPKTQAVY